VAADEDWFATLSSFPSGCWYSVLAVLGYPFGFLRQQMRVGLLHSPPFLLAAGNLWAGPGSLMASTYMSSCLLAWLRSFSVLDGDAGILSRSSSIVAA
jgi:hypothetical protein